MNWLKHLAASFYNSVCIVPPLGQGRSLRLVGRTRRMKYVHTAEREGLFVELVQLRRQVGADGGEPVLRRDRQLCQQGPKQGHIQALLVLERRGVGQDIGGLQCPLTAEPGNNYVMYLNSCGSTLFVNDLRRACR